MTAPYITDATVVCQRRAQALYNESRDTVAGGCVLAPRTWAGPS
jgi:hypothetical protein